MRAYLYPILLGVSALAISLSSAYYSVYGLGALFAGASVKVMIMASTLELAKVVLAGFLHRFWKELPVLLRTYLTVAVTALIIISSLGIYGFLASAYKNSSFELQTMQAQVESVQTRKDRFQQQLDQYTQERASLTQSISQLTSGLSNNVNQYVDRATGQVVTTQSSSNRVALERQLATQRGQLNQVSGKIESLTDSLWALDARIGSIEQSSDASRNLGPLVFLSEVSGIPMDKAVNALIMVIMLVFDPLAITMIIATSVSFDTVRRTKPDDQGELIPFLQQPDPIQPPKPEQIQDLEQPQQVSTSEEPSWPEKKLLESSKQMRKVKQIRKVGNYYHVLYENNSIDRVHEDNYYSFVNTHNIHPVHTPST